MSKRTAEILLFDIRQAIEKIRKYTSGMNREGFISTDMAADAVVRNLEIIGEAANRLPEDFISLHPEIEWRKIVGLRHRIVHQYFGVDLDIIWAIIQKDLFDLEKWLTSQFSA
ncbi:MAG: DUF86 domain-containing protein [Thermodesulfobacteriota bacterium]